MQPRAIIPVWRLPCGEYINAFWREDMPTKPQTNCKFPHCPTKVAPGEIYCKPHRLKVDGDWHRDRETTHGRLYTKRWDRARRMFLAENPLCVQCRNHGRTEPASEVDHIKPHDGDLEKFWDRDNWQPLCKSHHSEKTAREKIAGRNWKA